MLRISLALLLACASLQAMAQNGRAAANAGACQETETLARDEAAQAGATHPKASAARTKYAKPTSVPSGGGDDQGLPRTHGAKWHSFLPGMFR